MTPGIVFSQGMRVFFLSAGIYSVLAMGVWEGWLAGAAITGEATALPFAPPPAMWHAHEMVFGYACAVLAGFFLTAVPGWTGEKSARAAFLTLLAGLWLAGRLAVWLSGGLHPLLVAGLDLAFLPVLGGKIALQLIRRPKPQNLMFIGLIALLWSGNLVVHLDWTGLAPGAAGTGLRMGLLTICATIAVIGGRVIPAFTRNAMLRSGRETGLPVSRRPAEVLGIGAAILLPVALGLGLPGGAVAVVALAAGGAQAVRLAGWRGGWARGQPILWSLHLAFAMLTFGYLALAASQFGVTGEVGALHVLGIGAIGGMTLAMMTRAALGHTNRPLVVARPIAIAYGMIALAALLRFLGTEAGPGWYEWSILISGALWVAGFAVFTVIYTPILAGPRLDDAV
ncbi:MAG TPA: NnrS family protein [Thermohalobaculum sp.]|nr:NnrS family protein [Thermohalobaculum sp.]